MKRSIQKLSALILALALCLSGCGTPGYDDTSSKIYTYDEAVAELESKLKKVDQTTIEPQPDLNMDTSSLKTLADISTFDLTVQGHGTIDIEIAAPSELSGNAPDDFINIVARDFNNQHLQVNGKTISVSVRSISSGETITYITEAGYRPVLYLPPSYSPGLMLESAGFGVIKLADRIAGNTAGILMKREVYDTFTAKYGEVTVNNIIEASLARDIIFGYTNPYTSNTGLDMLALMLYSFDPSNPLSDTATQKLIEYQQIAPTAAYTTGILRDQAAKGIIDAMVMEEQAFINIAELKSNYVFTPAGIRHDHPAYTFDYATAEEQEVARLFVEYCLTPEVQRLASQKGFNLHDEYVSQDPGLDGASYFAAQRVWKTNKTGGRPVVAVFVADTSSSMQTNGALTALKDSLLSASQYISSDNYIGLVSYCDRVFVNLKIGRFDDKQRSLFTGAVRNMIANGGTATYDAVLVALDMLREAAKDVPNAQMMLFVLSDGASQHGAYRLENITNIVAGMRIPVYTIGYNLEGTGESARQQLSKLSNINEATLIDTDSEGIINQLRNLFNVQL